jgi:hypothetical protein
LTPSTESPNENAFSAEGADISAAIVRGTLATAVAEATVVAEATEVAVDTAVAAATVVAVATVAATEAVDPAVVAVAAERARDVEVAAVAAVLGRPAVRVPLVIRLRRLAAATTIAIII